jgi:hypothetical protein
LEKISLDVSGGVSIEILIAPPFLYWYYNTVPVSSDVATNSSFQA